MLGLDYPSVTALPCHLPLTRGGKQRRVGVCEGESRNGGGVRRGGKSREGIKACSTRVPLWRSQGMDFGKRE